MKKVILGMIALMAVYQLEVFADECAVTYGSENIPFYQVWETMGDPQGNSGRVDCYYQDSKGDYTSYEPTSRGTPNFDQGDWTQLGDSNSYYCTESAASCKFYDN